MRACGFSGLRGSSPSRTHASSAWQPPEAQSSPMAGPRLSVLLTLLLSFALGSAGLEANNTRERIINGYPCRGGSHPWQVALFFDHEFQCSGVLVHKQWVLTVAHCHMSEYVVQMGSDLLLDVDLEEIKATASFIHPLYNHLTLDHDIMLVKLFRPAPLSPTVSTVEVPSSCHRPGTSCTVSGWGLTSETAGFNPLHLMCSDVKIISNNSCKKLYDVVLGRHTMCVADPDRGSHTCRGDSGSPLMCNGMLQGLVSSGYSPCLPQSEPVLFTRVCRSWIRAGAAVPDLRGLVVSQPDHQGEQQEGQRPSPSEPRRRLSGHQARSPFFLSPRSRDYRPRAPPNQ
ncbi:kallikrein-7-like [Pteronotus mesoamericanus]|uniref:kallikrein-7-like n=1 Tax=Pteronotus mesoamericanus TaxID=1884717 RepID=UPI0023ECCB5C|nr:kallikrein-7-like [Pteronotus parnellii mesoamericanus]